MSDFGVEATIVGGKKMASAFENASTQVNKYLADALNKTALETLTIAKMGTPKDTGNLRRHITPQLALPTMGNNMKAKVVVDNLVYAKAQEQGFITRKGKRIEFKNYTTGGTGAHYMQKAKDASRPILSNYLHEASRKIVAKLIT